MPFQYDRDFKSAAEMYEFLTGDLFKVGSVTAANWPGRNGFLFRGLPSSKYECIPSVVRDQNPLSKFMWQTPSRPDVSASEKMRREYVGLLAHQESRAVYIFLENSDKSGLDVPVDYELLKQEWENYSDTPERSPERFLKSMDLEKPFPSRRLSEAFALAQHHGTPTRLLDWTEDPLVALYFAAYRVSCACEEWERITWSDEIAVCVMNASMAIKAGIETVTVPRHRNTYMFAQKGIFTMYALMNKYFVEKGGWPTHESLLRDHFGGSPRTTPGFGKLTIPATEANDILRLVFQHGISRYSLMPSLDNIAKAPLYQRALFKPFP